MSNKNQLLEKEDKTIQIENENTNTNKLEQNSKEENPISEFVPVKKKNMDVLSIFTLFVVIFIGILLSIR